MKLTKKQFDQWVVEAIEMLPKRFLERMHNLVFAVDDRPTRLQMKECKLRRGYALFGLYQGYEQTGKRSWFSSPDKITIFRKAIMDKYRSQKKIREQVYKTVWHELAHHFGSDEAGAERAEERMFERFERALITARVQKREIKKTSKVRPGRRGYKRRSKVTFVVKHSQ